MRTNSARLIVRLLAGVVPCLLGSLVWAETGRVVETVDGDTIKVDIGGRVESIRLIGVDTPESVHPQKPVEYFAEEASAFTRRMTSGQMVRLEGDPQGANRDRYDRLLRYVFLSDGKLLNAEIILQGYGFAYVKYPFTRMEEFRALERQARESSRGLWGHSEEAPTPTPAQLVAGAAVNPRDAVYVTKSGTKYHRQGCRYLAKPAIPMTLKDAAVRYAPCSACALPRQPD